MVAHFTTRNPQLTTFRRVYKVSTKADGLVKAAERGDRVKAIRDARKMTGEEFAALVTKTAKALGVELALDKHKLSRIEGGKRDLTAEEVAMFVQLDPEDRGVQWLVFGGPRVAKAKRVG